MVGQREKWSLWEIVKEENLLVDLTVGIAEGESMQRELLILLSQRPLEYMTCCFVESTLRKPEEWKEWKRMWVWDSDCEYCQRKDQYYLDRG